MKFFPTTLLGVLFLTAVFVSNVTHEVPEGHYNGYMGTMPADYGKPHNVAHFVPVKECSPNIKLADTLLVVDYDNVVQRLSHDEVVKRQKSKSWADNVWVIGSC